MQRGAMHGDALAVVTTTALVCACTSGANHC